MSILAWFRGLFGKPTKKRQVVDNNSMYVGRDRPQHKQYYTLPQPGKLNELEVRFILGRFATSEASQVARKLNKMGYLTPRGKKWNQFSVSYWRQTEQKLEKRREYWRNRYWRNRKRDKAGTQTVIFRNADLRPRQNGVN